MTTPKLLSFLEQNIIPNMRYDALNYHLTYDPYSDSDHITWMRKIPQDKISATPQQHAMLLSALRRLQSLDDAYPNTDIQSIIRHIYQGNMSILGEYPSLRQSLLSDSQLSRETLAFYEQQDIATTIRHGVGNCYTLSALFRAILQVGNVKWNLGIRSIKTSYDPTIDHVWLTVMYRSHGTDRTITVDPVKMLIQTKQ